ncbi:DNA polymerase III subunit gamma/tau [Microbacteriaceae bacterium VKM Ac-2854]|nr:DNA polymerase III subunit gamma/tau [Microbacteriaceae bacterium VKM Ac-2854]
MTREQDDDALSWAGEENDPTLVPTHSAASEPVVAPTVAEPVAADEDAETAAPETDAAASSALLVTLGIAAGVYLLYTIGWIITGTRQSAQISTVAADVVGQFMYGLGLILAAAAPVLWFAGVLLLARKRRPGIRILLLVVGAVVLAPIPFVLGA